MRVIHLIQAALLVCLIVSTACDDNKTKKEPGTFTISGNLLDFGNTGLNAPSQAQELLINGSSLNRDLIIEVSNNFEIAIDNESFSHELILTNEQVNAGVTLLVRCYPSKTGDLEETLTISGEDLPQKTKTLKGYGINKLHTIKTFNNTRLAFSGEYSQKKEDTFSFPTDPTKVENITMYVKLRCPDGGCNAWDMFANIRLWNETMGKWLEIGRYITPYGVDNSQLFKGFPIDVTDFKNLLTGEVKLQTFIEVWGADGWLVSLDFEIIEDTPDYNYYAISPILDYAQHSLAGIPYGVENDFVVNKCITIPITAEATSFRTTISGWGHATPADNDARPCAEWCFRTHHILINDAPLFTHDMKGIGCANNPVQPQGGNWAPDRAGWCPGMEVPIRTDNFNTSMAGESFSYTYELEPWTNDLQASDPNAYYAISSFVVVKSNTPIEAPIVE